MTISANKDPIVIPFIEKSHRGQFRSWKAIEWMQRRDVIQSRCYSISKPYAEHDDHGPCRQEGIEPKPVEVDRLHGSHSEPRTSGECQFDGNDRAATTNRLSRADGRSKIEERVSAYRYRLPCECNTRNLPGPAMIPRAMDPPATVRSSRHGSCAEHCSADRSSVSSTHTMVGGISSVSGKGFLVYGSLPGVMSLPRYMCAS